MTRAMIRQEPRSSDDTIDSRDVDTRILELQEQLQGEISDLSDKLVLAGLAPSGLCEVDLEDSYVVRALDGFYYDEADKGQLAVLLDFRAEAKPCTKDWVDGAQLINENYLEKFARGYAEEVAPAKALWPYNHIDWEAAAEELMTDYTRVDFDGEGFYVRNT